jgi:light-regulated signal transduction histidine kinase (bacteriophytochrome)
MTEDHSDFRGAPAVALEGRASLAFFNAIRYTERGKVLIGCRRRGDRISIEVWGTGCGISEEHRSAVFEDFHQRHNQERTAARVLGSVWRSCAAWRFA